MALSASFARHIVARGGKVVISDVLDEDGAALAAEARCRRPLRPPRRDRCGAVAIRGRSLDPGGVRHSERPGEQRGASRPASSSSTSRWTTSAPCSRSTWSASSTAFVGGHRADARSGWGFHRQHLLGRRPDGPGAEPPGTAHPSGVCAA